MKKTIKLALSASLLLGATSAFATNGDVMIGQGAKSRAMGGVGIAKSFGAVSALANPANISSVKNMEFTGAVTYFSPSVNFGSNAAANAGAVIQGNSALLGAPSTTPSANAGQSAPITTADSDTAASVIPEIYFAQRVSDNFVYGVSVAGVAGMGTDYKSTVANYTAANASGKNGSFGMTTALSILKVSVPLAYTTSGLTVGLSPVFQYATLQMNYTKQSQTTGAYSRSTNPKSSSKGFGFELGLSYDMKDAGVEGLTLAAVYKSKIAMTYKNNIASAMNDFGVKSVKSGDKLDQPAEFGAGLSYAMSGNTIAIDYKNIQWSSAAGYGDFGWKDQNVIAVGYEYATGGWAFRAGYNHASNPIAEQNGAKGSMGTTGIANYDNAAVNFFNLAGFPGVVEQHITVGGGYSISDALSLDAAVVYAPKVSLSYNTSAMTEGQAYNGSLMQMGTNQANATAAQQATAGAIANAAAASTANVTHSQMGLTIAATYKF